MSNIQAQFPLLITHAPLVYLDTAATSQTPQSVLDAMIAYYTEYRANVHRGLYDIAVQADHAYHTSKQAVAALIGADEKEIVYTSGATASLNMLARMLEPEVTSKHNIVLTEMEHHANLIPWQQLAKRTGCELRFIPVTAAYQLDYEQAKHLIDEQTRIVSVVHASNTLGTVNDVTLLCQLTRSVGAYSIVDACQSIAHIQIDVREMNCDFLVASGHKMYGPTGIGFLYGKQERLEQLEPAVFGGDMIQSVSYAEATWAASTNRFEAGTPPIAGAIGLGAACAFLQEHRDTIAEESSHTAYLIDRLQSVGATVIGLDTLEGRVGVVSFTLGDAHPHDVADILAKNNIRVRAGHHCTMPLMKRLGLLGTVRASIGVYTTKDDIDRLVDGVQQANRILRIQ